MRVQAYLNFNGRAQEAIDFYTKALGAKVGVLMHYKDMPGQNPNIDPANLEKVMHASMQIGDTTLLVSDGRCTGATKFEGISLTLYPGSEADARKAFEALADGGKVNMPIAKTFFSPAFGMLTDRFGIMWMVLTEQ